MTRQRNAQLDEACAALGRNPAEISRSFLVGRTPETPFVSNQAFHDFVGSYREAGIDEFILYWVPQSDHQGMIGDEATLERIAGEAIPAIRAGEAAG